MSVFLAKRGLALVLTLLVASLVVFLVMEVLPGDPALIILGTGAQEDTLAALRQQMGLDQPMLSRYLAWIGGLVTGEMGESYTYGRPVVQLIGERVLISLPLAVMAILLSTAIALPLGVAAAARHGRGADLAIMGFVQLGVAVPNFWFAMLLILLFAVNLGWLPAVALALPQAAILSRVTRSSVLEVLQEDYVRTARAKGLTRGQALWRHGVRNALIPVVTIMGLQFSFLLAGTIIIENVFYLPGLGRLIFQAIAQRDLVVVKDLVVLLAASVIVVNFLVDLSYALLDPRLRLGDAR